METLTFEAEIREKGIKNSSKKAFRNNQVVGVLYNHKENIPIVFDRHDFEKMILRIRSNTLLNISVGKKKYLTFIKNYSFFLKNHRVRHVDFQAIVPGRLIKINVPLEYFGTPVGVSKGGFVQIFSKTVHIQCDSKNIPESIKVDISGLDINESIYLKSAPELPGVKYLESPYLSLVSVTISSRKKSEGAAAETAEKPAVAATTKTPEKK